MKKLMLSLLVGLGMILSVSAQSLTPSVVASAGEISKGEQINLEWTLGELAVSTVRSPSGLITEGFHQPNLKVENLGFSSPFTDQISPSDLAEQVEVQVAPNPVQSRLRVSIESDVLERGQMLLRDANGRNLGLIPTGIPVENKEIDFSSYASGMYYLSILSEEGELIQTLQITKVK